MDNKKQLIIIPPMSDAVKKLHEVLEGISADENIEITLIDDLKELSQVLKISGQCMIIVSNAKKCAMFLQENRAFLMKNSCKTILFTPKEIPAKTLVKFTKIGLTESILENSPPKTFLYKVKLLLRSIKTAKPQDDTDKVVKSLEQKAREEAELEVKEKAVQAENVIDMEDHDKKNQTEGETIDYGNPLKGKIKPVEENLDTHWKSDRKKSDGSPTDEEEDMATAISEQSAIDMYYRGKNKNLNVTEAEEDDFDKKMAELLLLEEEAKKKKSSFADIIDEGSIKQKRINILNEEEEPAEKIKLVELELTAGASKPKQKTDEPEEDDFDRMMAEALAKQEAERKKNEGFSEDLGGHLTGKVNTDKETEDIPEITQEKTYDNSELEEESKKPIELELAAADEKNSNKKKLEDVESESDPHEGEVDHIDGNMVGDLGTVDKIRTRMEGRSTYDENAELEENDEDHNKKRTTLDVESKDKERSLLEIEESDEESGAKREALRKDNNEDDKGKREKSIELELEAGDKKANSKKNDELDDDSEKKKLEPTLLEEERERKPSEVNAELEKKGREFEAIDNPEKSSGNNFHKSTAEKIDTYYRGGEAAKKKDHDWGNLTDKKDSLDLLPGKGKRNDGTAAAAAKADLGEQTIDYRKMKEEFDMINGEINKGYSPTSSASEAGQLINDDDAGSFKVQEIDPKSLDFSITIINSIFLKETKAKQIFSLLADELVNNYHCFPVFYSFKQSDKKFTEVFNPFLEIKDNRLNDGHREMWNEYKNDTALFEHFQEKSMTTWRCPEIVNNEVVWEDVELPSWAENELKNKKVELIFPYFDGIDRMGMAVVLFPEGIDPKTANGLLTVLEMARSMFLDTIQRYQVRPVSEDDKTPESAPVEEKKNVLGFIGGLFGKKKTG